MQLIVNGQRCSLEGTPTLEQLLEQQGYLTADSNSAANFVVAVNHTIIPLNDIASTHLEEDDQIDVMGAITGG